MKKVNGLSNWHKLIQLGVPVKGLPASFDLGRKLSTVRYKKTETSSKFITLNKDTQIEMWNEISEYRVDELNAPTFIISSVTHDKPAMRKAVELADNFINNGLRVRWHILGYNAFNANKLYYKDCDVLFISNVTKNSTPHRLEQLRDTVCFNHKILRVIVSADWNGIEISKATGIPVNGLVWLGR